jgi:ArsR family transcriptional regulator
MWKQALPLVDLAEACCAPLTDASLDEEQADNLAPMFKALGDPVRLRLLSMIASAPNGEICVCELTPNFAQAGPTISHHLKVLREAGLVAAERRGTWVYYWPRLGNLRELAALLDVAPPVPDKVTAAAS